MHLFLRRNCSCCLFACKKLAIPDEAGNDRPSHLGWETVDEMTWRQSAVRKSGLIHRPVCTLKRWPKASARIFLAPAASVLERDVLAFQHLLCHLPHGKLLFPCTTTMQRTENGKRVGAIYSVTQRILKTDSRGQWSTQARLIA